MSFLILFLAVSNALDCSQYGNYQQCTADTAYCQWTQSKCRCASPVNMDILFTISTSSYIGQSNFNNLLKPWLTTVAEMGINTGVSKVGYNVFSDVSTLTPISTLTYNQMADDIENIQYDAGVATDLAVALDTALNAFGNNTTDHSRQRINLIIMATNPYKEGTTSSEVCGNAATLKQAGIKNIFIGIGSQWNEARIDCLVEDVNTDIIHINEWSANAFNASLAHIYPFLCSVDPKIKITEIKTSQFVEFINLGIQIDETMQLTFDGLVSGNLKNTLIPQGSYVVLYDGKDASLSCSDCNAVFVECANNKNCEWNPKNMNDQDFKFVIKDETSAITFDEVSYSKNSYWPGISSSKSYSLEYIGYNNKYAANWVSSCDTTGTPGADTKKCTISELKCTLDTDCSLSGDTSAYCNAANGGVCVCGNGFYLKDNSCYSIPTPSDCIAYIVKNGTKRYTRFEWSAAEIDSTQIEYGIRYFRTGFDDNQMVTVLDVSRIRNEDDLYDGVNNIAGYAFTRITDENSNEYDSAKWSVNCSVKSQAPTSAPTSSPSDSPTFAPTESPTSAPTWSIPKVFLNGEFCDQDRCECFEQDFDCCMNAECEQQELSYIVGSNEIFQSVKIFPEAFPYEAEIIWKITFNGTIGGSLVNTKNDSLWNPLGVSVYPMNGSSKINGTTNVNIELSLYETNLTDILCTENGTKCISEYSLSGLQAVFVFEVLECVTSNGENGLDLCYVVYPNELVMYVERSDIGTLDGGGGGEDKVPNWVWIVLCAALVLLAFLSWLMYRYWWKGKVQDSDYQALNDDVEFQIVKNEQDFDTDLNANKDVAFNPLATGMPGVDKNNDPLTAEVEKRDKMQRNEMVEQDAVKEVFKEDMGQVSGKLYTGNQ